jgi:hypothetical protein
MAGELGERLSPADQSAVLADAAGRLDSADDASKPVDATLAALDRRGIIDGYTRSPYSVGLAGGAGAVVVQVSGYALSAHDDRLPVLPVTLELCRHHTTRPPLSVRVAGVDGGWQFTFVHGDSGEQNGLVSVPIEGVR